MPSTQSNATSGPVPLRGELPPDVLAATKTIHRELWGEPYVPMRGIMHFAGGSYWHRALLRQADRWERMAAAARVCAEWLPKED